MIAGEEVVVVAGEREQKADGHGIRREGDDGADPSPVELKARALATEEAGREVAGITNSEGAGSNAGRTVIALATQVPFRVLPLLRVS